MKGIANLKHKHTIKISLQSLILGKFAHLGRSDQIEEPVLEYASDDLLEELLNRFGSLKES